jgi:hypothetical protein
MASMTNATAETVTTTFLNMSYPRQAPALISHPH